jgi:outer membrane lipoprotein-sorting protein
MSRFPLATALVLLALAGGEVRAAALPDGETILARVDENIASRNKIIEAKMVIHGRRGTRTVESRSWIEGNRRSFTEYLAPARERGTKMLKIGDELWTYTPATDRTIRIAGHLLRQSVMGSDLSYEDLMEDPRLAELYTAATAGADTLAGRPCWILDLASRGGDIAYQSRRVWVDQERGVLLREERFAKSGMLLKTTEVREVRQIDGHWVAAHIVFRDALRDAGGTEFILADMTFDAAIPPATFSKAALRK